LVVLITNCAIGKQAYPDHICPQLPADLITLSA